MPQDDSVTARIIDLQNELTFAGLNGGRDTILAHLESDGHQPSRAKGGADPETGWDNRPETAEMRPQLLHLARGRAPQLDPAMRLLRAPGVTHASLWPRDSHYVVPLAAVLPEAETMEAGVNVAVRLTADF